MSAARVLLGDCAEVLKGLPDASVDACVTDPPYGISFMGKGWDSDVPPSSIWAEVLRVLKPGAHLLAFAGTRTHHRMATRIEDAGFEIRDMVAWVYGSGFPKSHNQSDDWQGWGTALKPAMEPITVARKPLAGTVAANLREHGVGALNIQRCRIEGAAPATVRGAGGRNGKYGPIAAQGLIHDDGMGRWPANLIHDGSDDVLAAFPIAKGQQGFVGQRHGAMPGVNTYGDFGPRPDWSPRGDVGSAARFFYCAKASTADRDDGLDGPKAAVVQFQTGNGTSGKPSSLSEGRDTQRRNPHPTVKPTELMRYLCRLVTPPGGLVLDPFAGTGSTGRGAVLEGFQFIGIEREEDYCRIAHQRIAAAEEAARVEARERDLAARQGTLL